MNCFVFVLPNVRSESGLNFVFKGNFHDPDFEIESYPNLSVASEEIFLTMSVMKL